MARVRKKREEHGLRYHPLYARWLMMLDRCTNPNNHAYDSYGGRGITVCERWRDFPKFLADMGEPPPGMSLDRINNDKGYEPNNCRWATQKEQSNNRRNVRKLELYGKTQCLSDWAKELGITEGSLRERLEKWPIERALSTPKLPNIGGKHG